MSSIPKKTQIFITISRIKLYKSLVPSAGIRLFSIFSKRFLKEKIRQISILKTDRKALNIKDKQGAKAAHQRYNGPMEYSVCLLAAGKGSRTQLDYNKVFYHLNSGKTVLETITDLFLKDPDCKQVIVVHADYEKKDILKLLDHKDERLEFTHGGATRQESVYNALQKVSQKYVMIHDAARPYLRQQELEKLKTALLENPACLLMVPEVDTVKKVDENGYVIETLNRSQIWKAQTPQCFQTDLIKEVHEIAKKKEKTGTDDAQLVEWFSKVPVLAVQGISTNTKITNPEDLKYAFDY